MKPNIAAALETISSNEDLLAEILVRLPPKSLLRFKSVSKAWLRLSSSRQLRCRNSERLCKDISGLILVPRNIRPYGYGKCDFTPVDINDVAVRTLPFESLDFVPSGGKLEVISHCNGLLLCSTRLLKEEGYSLGRDCYVLNPTTKDYATVSADKEIGGELFAVNLAFDPRKSHHYKLLFIFWSDPDYTLYVYASDTGAMRKIEQPIPAPAAFREEVYWNGAVNWLTYIYYTDGLYFNVDEERFGVLPMLPPVHVPEGVEGDGVLVRHVVYFGESNDHLHIIEHLDRMNPPPLQLNVYEMDREYSGWFVRYRVDLRPLFNTLLFTNSLFVNISFGVACVVQKDDDAGSFLVVNTTAPDVKVFRYDLQDNSFEEIFVIRNHDWRNTVQFIQSLYCP